MIGQSVSTASFSFSQGGFPTSRNTQQVGKWRFGIGYSMHGTTGIVMLCIYGLMNLMWYMILGCCWITYGVIWLCFVLPINGIIKLCKNRKYNTQNAFKQENTQTDTPFVHPNGSKYCKRYIQTHNLPSVKSAFWVVFTLILHKNHLFADRHEHL